MKKLILITSGIIVVCGGRAAEPSALKFGGERIGVPSLSLADSIARSAATSRPYAFGGALPTYSTNADPADLGPNLLPRPSLNRAPSEALRRAHGPRVSRSSGMPIITPDNAVDYKLVIVPPNPSVDYKMIIRDLSGEAKAEAAK